MKKKKIPIYRNIINSEENSASVNIDHETYRHLNHGRKRKIKKEAGSMGSISLHCLHGVKIYALPGDAAYHQLALARTVAAAGIERR